LTACAASTDLAAAGFGEFKISIVVTRQNVSQLDKFKRIADDYGARLRVTRLRPSGRGADSWADLHPTAAQQHVLYDWLSARPDVLTGDSFFHLSALGGFTRLWRESELLLRLREPAFAGACASCGQFDACQGGCIAAKFFTGLPLDGPDPECVLGHGERELAKVWAAP
jgi:radical SAM protein with 4Fe4S-binding SPASM domain